MGGGGTGAQSEAHVNIGRTPPCTVSPCCADPISSRDARRAIITLGSLHTRTAVYIGVLSGSEGRSEGSERHEERSLSTLWFKNIHDIFGCSVIRDCKILIIFDKSIPD